MSALENLTHGDVVNDLACFAGMHVIDGRGEYVRERSEHSYEEDSARCFILRIDGVLFVFTENPCDGYRSMLGGAHVIAQTDTPPGSFASFDPIVVTVHHFNDRTRDVIVGVNERTDLPLFEIGTINNDDYYPSFISRWSPEGRSEYLDPEAP